MSRFGYTLAILFAFVIIAGFLSSCQLAKNQLTTDRSADRDRQDFRDILAPPPMPSAEAGNDVPDFQPIMATPAELKLPTPLVTVSVNQTVSLRDLLFELTRQADVDLEFDPQIHGSLVFTAREKPFDQVVDRICEMAGLRYKFADNVLRVELDRPFIKNYSVDYLNINRTAETEINTSVSISNESGSSSSTGATAGSSGSISGGSSSSISSEFEGNFWDELQENLDQILTSSDVHIALATLADPQASASGSASDSTGAAAASTQPPSLTGGAGTAAVNITTPEAEPFTPNPPATYSLSRQSGILSVFASQKQQKLVQKYLEEFRKRATTQVLIEAKIFQVDLLDEYNTGIDWGSFDLTGMARMTANFARPAFDPTLSAGNTFTAVLRPGNDLRATINAMNRFGTVRTLSSPRITAINNQPAIVNVAKNVVYFVITNQSTTTTNDGGTTTTGGAQATATAIPEGVLLNVIPQANSDTGEVSLIIRPTITKVTDFVDDPTPRLLLIENPDADPDNIIENRIPVLATQEMDSIVKMQSGQTMVLGGLMKDANSVDETGAPVLGDIPVVGNLFKGHGDVVDKSELVIFLTATVIAGSNVDDTDRRIYKDFSADRHPARM